MSVTVSKPRKASPKKRVSRPSITRDRTAWGDNSDNHFNVMDRARNQLVFANNVSYEKADKEAKQMNKAARKGIFGTTYPKGRDSFMLVSR